MNKVTQSLQGNGTVNQGNTGHSSPAMQAAIDAINEAFKTHRSTPMTVIKEKNPVVLEERVHKEAEEVVVHSNAPLTELVSSELQGPITKEKEKITEEMSGDGPSKRNEGNGTEKVLPATKWAEVASGKSLTSKGASLKFIPPVLKEGKKSG